MTEVFLKIVNMSISAGWAVLAVLLLRFLLKKAPKWIRVLLWGVVGLRLVSPFTIESAFSLIPSAETIDTKIAADSAAAISGAVPAASEAVNSVAGTQPLEKITANTGLLQNVLPVLAAVWVAGMAAMLIYSAVSCLRIKSKVKAAVRLEDNIFQSENVFSPFVFGIVKPKIYLPFGMSKADLTSVAAHEQAHIKRRDHLWKPLGFILTAVYWFNPLIWLAYILLCKDIELACDEKVVKNLSAAQRANYSQSLLTLSVSRRMIAACPLAFGETGVKGRVKSVLSYKKPAFWVVIVAIAASVATAVCFLTSPKTTVSDELSFFIDDEIISHWSSAEKNDNFAVAAHKVFASEKSGNETTVYMLAMHREYSRKNNGLNVESGSVVPTVITAREADKAVGYELVEFWTPGDGTQYAADIKEKFPLRLQRKALDITKYSKELEKACFKKASEHFGLNANTASAVKTYGKTPTEKISQKNENEEFVITTVYSKRSDGMWTTGDNEYRYRLEITGKAANAKKSTTFLVLSNSRDITFEQCLRAFGFSSQSKDYFKSDYAVIVGCRMFS